MRMTSRGERWLRPALVALGTAVAAFAVVAVLRGGSAADSNASAAAAAVTRTALPPAAQYSEMAPPVFSKTFLYPPQNGVTPTLPAEHPAVSVASFVKPVSQYIAYS